MPCTKHSGVTDFLRLRLVIVVIEVATKMAMAVTIAAAIAVSPVVTIIRILGRIIIVNPGLRIIGIYLGLRIRINLGLRVVIANWRLNVISFIIPIVVISKSQGCINSGKNYYECPYR
jgi:hypothetical protein